MRQIGLMCVGPRTVDRLIDLLFRFGLGRRQLGDDDVFGLCSRVSNSRVSLGASALEIPLRLLRIGARAAAYFFELRFQVAACFGELFLGAPLRIVDLRSPRAQCLFDLRGRDPQCVVDLRGRRAPRMFDAGISGPSRIFGLRLCSTPHVFELRSQRVAKLVHLILGGAVDFLGLLLCGIAKLRDLRIGLLLHLRRRSLDRLLHRTFALLHRRALDLLNVAPRRILNLRDLRLRFRLPAHVRSGVLRSLLRAAIALLRQRALQCFDLTLCSLATIALISDSARQLVRNSRELALELRAERSRDPFEGGAYVVFK
jgi:hypothetical protein